MAADLLILIRTARPGAKYHVQTDEMRGSYRKAHCGSWMPGPHEWADADTVDSRLKCQTPKCVEARGQARGATQ